MSVRSFAVAVLVIVAGLASRAHAAITVAGNGHDFSTVHLGNAVMANKPLSVPGPSAESYDSITLSGAGGTSTADCNAQFSFAPTSQSVPFGGAATLTITFAPTKRQVSTCNGTLRNGGVNVGTFQLAGVGVAPVVTIVNTPLPVNFGAHRVAGSTTTLNVQVRNTGNADLEITGVSLAASDFAFVTAPTLPITIAPTTNAAFPVRFDPSAPGTRTGQLVIAARDPVAGTAPIADTTVNLTGVGGTARISVGDGTFGIAPNGTTTTMTTIRVINDATMSQLPLNLMSASITGSSWVSFATNGAFGCAPGSTTCSFPAAITTTPLDITLVCTPTPTATGTESAMVAVASDSDPGGDAIALVTCTAGRSDMTASVTMLAFGDQRVGTASTPRAFTLANTGNTTGTYTIVKSGDGGEFSVTGCPSSGSVPPGAMATCSVVFQPTSVGMKTATFSIATNDPDPGEGTKLISPVSGTGVLPQIAGPVALDFGNVDSGTSSAATTLAVQNAGTEPLTISMASVSSGGAVYAIMTGSMGTQVVPPGGSTSWSLVCTPGAQGPNPGQFRIVSNSATSSTLNVTLACSGQRGLFVASPPSHDFGSVQSGMSVPRTIDLTNPGNLELTGVSAAIMPAGIGYAVTTQPPGTLAANGGTGSTIVTFAPTSGADGGPATLRITGTWTGVTAHTATIDIPLNGDGLAAGVDVTPATIDFGTLRWNTSATTPFCVVNTSQFAVQVQNISIAPLGGTLTGEFTRGTMRRQTTCGTGGTVVSGFPITLAPNESLQVQMTVDPMDRVGMLLADVTIMTSLVANPTRHVMLSAVSTSGELTIDPAAMVLDFGPTDLDGGPVTRDITIANTGTADLDLGNFARTANPHITMTLPPGATTLAPGAMLRIPVTYAPVSIAMDATTLTFQLANVLNGPTSGTIAIQGRGADREISVAQLQLQFPDTFKNPGAMAPVLDVVVANLGEAVLHVTAATIIGDDQFSLLGDVPAADIVGLGSHVFRVRFTPRSVGDTTTSRLVLTNDDDAEPMAEIGLAGTGLARDVSFGPRTIELGFVGVGAIVRVADVLEVTNRDPTNSFSIRTISASDPQFFVYDAGDVPIAPGELRSFDLGFAPTVEGVMEVPARLYLDEDPDAHAIVMLRATAVSVDVHGGGGCSAGGGGGMLGLLVAAATLLRGRAKKVART